MDNTRKILIADDDANILQVAGFAIQKAGFSTVTAADGRKALELFRQEQPDLVVLDVMMPELDGTDVCRAIRAESDTPVIFLSSRDEELDRIVGLELGADDYITKPFSPRELVTRIKTVLRRSRPNALLTRPAETGNKPLTLLGHGLLQLDQDRFQAYWDGQEVQLTATEFNIIKGLLSFPGKVFSRSELMDRAYGGETFISDRTVDSHIRHIRDKFRLAGGEPLETVHGIGYKLSDCLKVC